MNIQTTIQTTLYLFAFVTGLLTLGLAGHYYLISETVSGLAYMMGTATVAVACMSVAYAMEVI